MKKGIILTIMLTFMMMLVGCVNLDLTLDLEKDGTGRAIVELVGPTDMMTQLNDEEIAQLKSEYESVEIISEGGKYGYKLTTKKEDLKNLDEVLPSLTEGDVDTTDINYDQYIIMNEEKGLFTNTFKMDLKLKEMLFSELSAEERSMINFIGNAANIGIHIKSPMELEESNATSVTEEDNKHVYNWDYTLSNLDNISITMKAPNILNIGIIVVLIIAVIIGVVVMIRKKKSTESINVNTNNDENKEE